MIKSCGFYHTKAENILRTCGILVREYGGQVPKTMEGVNGAAGGGPKDGQCGFVKRFWYSRDRGGYARAARVQSTGAGACKGRRRNGAAVDAHHSQRQVVGRAPLADMARKKSLQRTKNPTAGDCFLADICEWEPGPVITKGKGMFVEKSKNIYQGGRTAATARSSSAEKSM